MTVAEAFVYFIVKTGDTESVFMTRVRQTDVCEQFGRLVHRVTNNGGKCYPCPNGTLNHGVKFFIKYNFMGDKKRLMLWGKCS